MLGLVNTDSIKGGALRCGRGRSIEAAAAAMGYAVAQGVYV